MVLVLEFLFLRDPFAKLVFSVPKKWIYSILPFWYFYPCIRFQIVGWCGPVFGVFCSSCGTLRGYGCEIAAEMSQDSPKMKVFRSDSLRPGPPAWLRRRSWRRPASGSDFAVRVSSASPCGAPAAARSAQNFNRDGGNVSLLSISHDKARFAMKSELLKSEKQFRKWGIFSSAPPRLGPPAGLGRS